MSFHFRRVFPVIYECSVWHNGSTQSVRSSGYWLVTTRSIPPVFQPIRSRTGHTAKAHFPALCNVWKCCVLWLRVLIGSLSYLHPLWLVRCGNSDFSFTSVITKQFSTRSPRWTTIDRDMSLPEINAYTTFYSRISSGYKDVKRKILSRY